MMTIRPYTVTDRQSVIGLWSSVFSDSKPHNDPEPALDAKLKQADGLLLVAEQDAVVVGTVMGGYDGHRGWIYSLAVHPDCRRMGIASALLEKIQELLRERGCLKLNLQVRNTNSDVIDFYKKCGFGIDDVTSLGKRLY